MRSLIVFVNVVAAIALSAGASWGYFVDTAYVPDIETFMQIGGNSSLQVSRDGSVRCFSSAMSGVSQAYRLDANGWPVQLTFFTDGISFYALSHDGKWAIVGAAVGGSEQTNLYLLEVATGRIEPVTDLDDVQIASVLWSNDDRHIYYRSNEVNKKDFHAYEMNLATRKVRPVFVQEGYNGPSLITPDDKRLVTFRYNSNVDNELYLVNLADGSVDPLTPHEGNQMFEPGGFSVDMNTLYIVTNANDDGIMRRATLDVGTKQITFLDAASPWEVEGLTLSDDTKTLAWTVNEKGYSRLKLWDLTADRELPLPPLDGLISGVDFAGNDAVSFTFTSAARPPDCWIWNLRTQKLQQLTQAVNAGIDASIFVEPELVTFPSFDGLEISAFLFMPPGAKKGDRVPFIVHCHGGPESQFRPTFIRNFQYFALNGFGLLAVNPRGSSGYGREFQDMDNYKDRHKSVKDYEFATRWIVEQGYAHPDKVGVSGGSYGGYMTLACLTTNPELYAAGVDLVGIANFYTFLKNTADYRRGLRESEYGPMSDSAFLMEISPVSHVDRIAAPLFIIHGENDPRVPVGEARQMAAAIAQRGGIVDTLIFPDEGHGVAKRENILVAYRRIVDFFRQHLTN
ncbi:MAG TPA: S9 family peptidase [candidate division Zixibacteria bacterium]|jgi:dipeptidyl aminopeptidase/acylaminoacyl peptidase